MISDPATAFLVLDDEREIRQSACVCAAREVGLDFGRSGWRSRVSVSAVVDCSF